MPTTPMALYYPWMHFQDDAWLKTSLLTWEKLVRVRPPGIEDRDNDLVRRVREKADLLIDIVPSRSDLQVVSDAFASVIHDYRAYISQAFDASGSCHPDETYLAPVSQRITHVLPNDSPGALPGERLTWVYTGPGGPRMGPWLQAAQKRASPVAYLLAANRSLSGKSLLESLRQNL